jgi:two-component system response regulator RegA
VVDDDDAVRRGWERSLRSELDAVYAVADRTAALAVVPLPDVAIVDQHLGGGDSGIEVLRALKSLKPTIYTVLISAAMSVPLAIDAMRAGIDDCVVKPVVPRALLRRIQQGETRPDDELLSLEDVEWEHISQALREHSGNITHTAKALRIHRQSLQRKLRSRTGRLR